MGRIYDWFHDYDPDAVEWDLYEIGEDGEDPDDEVSEEVGGVIDGAVGGGEVTAGRR